MKETSIKTKLWYSTTKNSQTDVYDNDVDGVDVKKMMMKKKY